MVKSGVIYSAAGLREMTFFWITALTGGVFLLAASIYLVSLNWSEEMWPRLISALGIGAITLLVAVLASLKGSREERKFTAAVVFDEATHRPPITWPDPDRAFDSDYQRMSRLTSLTLELKETPQTTGEVFTYCAELLQYKLLTDMRDIQRSGTGIGTALGASSSHVFPSQTIVKLPDEVELQPFDFPGYASNRFSKTESAVFGWQKIYGGLRVPRGTRVELYKLAGPEKHVIRLFRKDYFTFEISVEPIVGGATGKLPEGLHFLDDKV